jgi:hypothetical protein
MGSRLVDMANLLKNIHHRVDILPLSTLSLRTLQAYTMTMILTSQFLILLEKQLSPKDGVKASPIDADIRGPLLGRCLSVASTHSQFPFYQFYSPNIYVSNIDLRLGLLHVKACPSYLGILTVDLSTSKLSYRPKSSGLSTYISPSAACHCPYSLGLSCLLESVRSLLRYPLCYVRCNVFRLSYCYVFEDGFR